MGKEKSRSQNLDLLIEMKDHHITCSEMLKGCDPLLGRRMSVGDGGHFSSTKTMLLHGLNGNPAKFSHFKAVYAGKKHMWLRKHLRLIVFLFGLMGFVLLLDPLLFSAFGSMNYHNSSDSERQTVPEEDRGAYETGETPVKMYGRLLNLASSSLAEKEFKQDSSDFWKEPYWQASAWKPCADRKILTSLGKPDKSNGFLLVSANGGLNQQRVAVCNAVAVASLLNATLVIPKFLYSNVWKDPSQFSDIYQEDYFINLLKDDIDIVKALPRHLKSVDIEEIGSLITDSEIVKEAKPVEYVNTVLPILLRNGVVHFLGFGNRLGFDPVPLKLQRLRCKCNFHALKFVPKIQQMGSLLIKRIRKYNYRRGTLDTQLLEKFISNSTHSKMNSIESGPSKYLALHLRFEIDMVSYSQCEFGGGETERRELQAYRENHFPLLIERLKKNPGIVSPKELRKLGKCPLTPEEAALVLAGSGFKRGTYIYLAGSHIYGGKSRVLPFTSLYPNLVTKEDLLTPRELSPFRNFSSQMAALDFIACATSDAFAMTDSGSQLSSLVSGFRTYYGKGQAPTLRPNKKRLASILMENKTIGWSAFEERIRKMIDEGQRPRLRGYGRSIYRQPRCPECMCKSQ